MTQSFYSVGIVLALFVSAALLKRNVEPAKILVTYPTVALVTLGAIYFIQRAGTVNLPATREPSAVWEKGSALPTAGHWWDWWPPERPREAFCKPPPPCAAARDGDGTRPGGTPPW